MLVRDCASSSCSSADKLRANQQDCARTHLPRPFGNVQVCYETRQASEPGRIMAGELGGDWQVNWEQKAGEVGDIVFAIKTMLIFNIALVLLPVLGYAFNVSEEVFYDISDIEVTHDIPTMEEMQSIYPDVDFGAMNGLVKRQGQAGFRIYAGGLAMAGYYSLGGGDDKVDATIDACTDPQGVGGGLKCANKIISTAVAHSIAAGAGLVGGQQFIMYFWHAAAEQAQGPAAAKRWLGSSTQIMERQSCSQQLSPYATSVRFNGQYGIKIAGKDFSCFSPDSAQLGYVQAMANQVAPGIQSNGALDTYFTIYEQSSNSVLGRFHVELDTVQTDVCPFDIAGGDSCSF
nr:hypothetical protein CFP56_22515 [Quercus suber]